MARGTLTGRTLPSFFLLLFGIFIWVNFSQYGPPELYTYYPVILIGVTVAIIFLPLPILGHKSRSWLAYSHVSIACTS